MGDSLVNPIGDDLSEEFIEGVFNMFSKLKVQSPTEEEVKFIYKQAKEYNKKYILSGQEDVVKKICRVIKDPQENVIAGIVGYVSEGLKALDVSLLWVKKEFRKLGYGTILLQHIEREMFESCVDLIYLGTIGFQAKDFYLKHGYEIFGVLDECAENNKVYYLKKKLNKTNINLEISNSVQEGTCDDSDYIDEEIIKFNGEKEPFTNEEPFKDINKVIKDSENNVIAGICTTLLPWNDLSINKIWTREDLAAEELTSTLLIEIEKEVKENGCNVLMYETMDDKSMKMCIKNDYEVYGILGGYQGGQKVYYMKKIFN